MLMNMHFFLGGDENVLKYQFIEKNPMHIRSQCVRDLPQVWLFILVVGVPQFLRDVI
jgi:hypothetical protein